MNVSVIIPVYNAERFLLDCVHSALDQPETAEILMIEDGSTDKSYEICKQLCKLYPKVKLLRHPGGENRGAGASRNLGIKNAKYENISFLDADDYFLPFRFTLAARLFLEFPDIEGVYEAVGVEFDDDKSKLRWFTHSRMMLTTMRKRVPPDKFFENQSPVGSMGYCPTGGWIVKKSIFKKIGYFDENLRLHQDTAMFVKFAAIGRMMAGELENPVAIRRVHSNNRSSADRPAWEIYKSEFLMWDTLLKWSDNKKNLSEHKKKIIFRRFFRHALKPFIGEKKIINNIGLSIFQAIRLFLYKPGLIFDSRFWHELFVLLKTN